MLRWLERFRNRPAAPWEAPRPVSQQNDAEDYSALKQRLDTAWRDGREAIYRDRDDGSYWKGVAYDHGPIGAGDEVLTPLGSSPPDGIALREEFDDEYSERYISRFGLWQLDNWTFKVYGIVAGERGLSEDRYYQSAKQSVAALIPEANATAHHDNGFVIVHYGTEQVWLLINWWVQGGICAGRLLKAPLDGTPEFEPVQEPLIACVWELTVIEFERHAWVDIILKRTGSLPVYQQHYMPPGYY